MLDIYINLDMKYMSLIFIFLSTFLWGQKLVSNPYEHKMDSIAIAHFKSSIIQSAASDFMLSYRPYKWVKLTVKVGLNPTIVTKMTMGTVVNGNVVTINPEAFNVDDYLSMGAYDVRGKIYVNKKFSLITRMLVNGIETKTYFYYGGFVLMIK
jgi:hypothetical protein